MHAARHLLGRLLLLGGGLADLPRHAGDGADLQFESQCRCFDASLLQGEYVAPQSELEQQIAAIWADVLKLEKVGLTDNFFELGGDSILSLQIIARAKRQGIEHVVVSQGEFVGRPSSLVVDVAVDGDRWRVDVGGGKNALQALVGR